MRRGAVLVLAALAVAACTGDDAGPSPRPTVTSSTSVIDRSGIALAGVPGETTTSAPRTTGTATLVGTVSSPGGLVPGATVRVERLVGTEVVRTDVLTGPDGRFTLAGVPGGRYRVRAFFVPILAQTTAEVRFLADGEEHSFELAMQDQQGLVVRSDVAPDAPVVDGLVNLLVVVANRTVDPDGIVRSQPVVGSFVELAGLGAWTLAEPGRGSATVRLDSTGRARWELRCTTAGAPGLVLRVPITVAPPAGSTAGPTASTETVTLELPACGGGPTTTAGDGDPDATSTTEP